MGAYRKPNRSSWDVSAHCSALKTAQSDERKSNDPKNGCLERANRVTERSKGPVKTLLAEKIIREGVIDLYAGCQIWASSKSKEVTLTIT